MLAGIRAQPGWLAHGARDALEEARAVVHGPVPPAVYLVGCGDSHYAGVAARHAFQSWSGIPTQALPSLQFSRYDVEHAEPGAWAICVSNSGRVARTLECAVAAKRHRLRPIGVTYSGGSPLADRADAVVTYHYDDPGFAPGTLSYLASLAVLLALALRAREIAGAATAADVAERLRLLEAQAVAAAETIELAQAAAEQLAKETDLDVPIRIVGGGPSFGTALYGRAKLIESARVPAQACELEEWAHEEYFCTGPGTLTIVVAPAGASADRAVEQLQAIRDVGGTAAVVCPSSSAAVDDVVALPVAGDPPELLSPLTFCIPLQLFAYHLASTRGLTMLGFDDDRRREVNFRQIFDSRIAGE
jgi:glucosamine 6-phosphate synthetase-like amidotransferase/phosphosugar isomerase protein